MMYLASSISESAYSHRGDLWITLAVELILTKNLTTGILVDGKRINTHTTERGRRHGKLAVFDMSEPGGRIPKFIRCRQSLMNRSQSFK